MRRLLALAGLSALAGLGVLMLAPALLGYERYVVTGGSMGSAVPRGSIAFEEVVPPAELRVGDVITYRPPGAERLVTHRIASIGRRGGERLYRTRGDANSAPDPRRFTLPGSGQARLVFHVPVAGWALAALSVRAVRMAVIGGPALAIACTAFAGLVPVRRRGRAIGFG